MWQGFFIEAQRLAALSRARRAAEQQAPSQGKTDADLP